MNTEYKYSVNELYHYEVGVSSVAFLVQFGKIHTMSCEEIVFTIAIDKLKARKDAKASSEV